MSDVVERTELLVPGPAEGLSALLDVPLPDFTAGEGLPLLWHWLYLLDRPAQRDVGRDGHPVRGTVPAPPEPNRRRMWAGGRVETLGVLHCGEQATRRTTVLSTQTKQGRSGTLTFLAVGHQIYQHGHVVVDERQDLVYRDAAASMSTGSDPDADVPAAPDEWSVDVSPSLLFRFSALTYNGHRIHYDRDYARDVEGYPGLVTHGPLQAVVMAEAARAKAPGSSRQVFDYRLVSPLFEHQGLIARALPDGARVETTVRDRFGRQSAQGVLTTG
jgi:3-methylfumaryl-CoA hydratase